MEDTQMGRDSLTNPHKTIDVWTWPPSLPRKHTDVLHTLNIAPLIYNVQFPLAVFIERTGVLTGLGFSGDSGREIEDSANVDEWLR